MRRLVFIILTSLLLVLPTVAGAQVRFGVVGGFTSSSSNVKEFSTSSVSLYHAGVTVKLPLGPVTLQPSLLYQVKGSTLDDVLSGDKKANLETKAGFVEIPLQIQVGLKLGPIRPYAFGEPFVGFGITNSASSDSFVDSIKNSWKESGLNRWEYGLGLGAGVELLGHIQISAKYFWNFGSLADNNDKVSASDIGNTVRSAFKDGRNFNGISVSAALLF